MKAVIIIIIILVLAFFGLKQLGFIGDSKPARQDTRQEQAQPAKPTTETKREQPGAIESVIDYGTGYTQLKVKKKQESKLDKIQNDKNKQLEDALSE